MSRVHRIIANLTSEDKIKRQRAGGHLVRGPYNDEGFTDPDGAPLTSEEQAELAADPAIITFSEALRKWQGTPEAQKSMKYVERYPEWESNDIVECSSKGDLLPAWEGILPIRIDWGGTDIYPRKVTSFLTYDEYLHCIAISRGEAQSAHGVVVPYDSDDQWQRHNAFVGA